MACDELSEACRKVGNFLYDFALVEEKINEGIAKILNLKGDAPNVVAHSVDFFRKANMLQTIALETAPDDKKVEIKELFSLIAEKNNDRVLMAHSPFDPAQNEAVQFRRTVAKDGKVKVQDPLWSKEKFEQASMKLKEIRQRLDAIQPYLIFRIADGRTQIFAHFLYAPTSNWVPKGDEST